MAPPRIPRQITPTSPSPSPEPEPSSASGTTPQIKKEELPSSSSATTTMAAVTTEASGSSQAALSQQVSQDEVIRANFEAKVRSVVDLLYQVAVCAADVQDGSEHLVGRKINDCVKALADLDNTKHSLKAMVPQEVIEMLDVGKNPDIHTRNFINRLASENQYSYGQNLAMQEYNDQLNLALENAFPVLAQPLTKSENGT